MNYKKVVLTQKGGPEALKVEQAYLRTPNSNELQIKVLACGVGRSDIAMQKGYYPYAPKIPFVPGYEIVGKVTAVGEGISSFKKDDIVAALTVYGGYAEYIFLDKEHLVRVPENLRPDMAVALILNYCTAYQIMNRVLTLKKNDTVLVTGASGGVGSALLDLGKAKGLKIYGTASKEKHSFIKDMGAIPIDYKRKDWISNLRKVAPHGFDYVIDGIGGSYINKGFSLLKKGGRFLEYGYPNFFGMLFGIIKIKLYNLLPNRKKGNFYGISNNYQKDKSEVKNDLKLLFDMLGKGNIAPKISKRYPILEAAKAITDLDRGDVIGKIVLVSPDVKL